MESQRDVVFDPDMVDVNYADIVAGGRPASPAAPAPVEPLDAGRPAAVYSANGVRKRRRDNDSPPPSRGRAIRSASPLSSEHSASDMSDFIDDDADSAFGGSNFSDDGIDHLFD